MLKADDQFFRRPSAIICNKNKSDKVLKFVSKYINTHGRVVHPQAGGGSLQSGQTTRSYSRHASKKRPRLCGERESKLTANWGSTLITTM